ncbi:hypothetical protein NTGM5_180056 [Candidatus Nitrotoga sp. M5]|nr:hypothetical protein NTGM5_180056 [Candidatus Nitrotoga sp. M5]
MPSWTKVVHLLGTKRERLWHERIKQTLAIKLLSQKREHVVEVLCSVIDFRVPFTSNLGECAIRISELKHIITGCFSTLKGREILPYPSLPQYYA